MGAFVLAHASGRMRMPPGVSWSSWRLRTAPTPPTAPRTLRHEQREGTFHATGSADQTL